MAFSARLRRHDPDADWERFGREEPYYGVYANRRFLRSELDEQRLAEFFESGERHVAAVFETIERRLRRGFVPRRALELGCGVGRLLIPLARRCEQVVGVDVSASMLEEARRNLDARDMENVRCVGSIEAAGRGFDLVHSFVVLQHVPPRHGEALIASLVDALADDGIGAVHVTFANGLGWRARLLRWARRTLPLVHPLWNWKDGKPLDAPWMQMNRYDLNRIFWLLQERGCHDVVVRFTNHFGHRGVVLCFRKRAAACFP